MSDIPTTSSSDKTQVISHRPSSIRLLLKKSRLDTGDMKKFCSVSNLSFFSKLLERIVQCRLQAFLDSN